MSALPQKADIPTEVTEVCYWPKHPDLPRYVWRPRPFDPLPSLSSWGTNTQLGIFGAQLSARRWLMSG
jgi:hypothetical protein